MRYVVGCSVIWVIFVVSEIKQLSCLAFITPFMLDAQGQQAASGKIQF